MGRIGWMVLVVLGMAYRAQSGPPQVGDGASVHRAGWLSWSTPWKPETRRVVAPEPAGDATAQTPSAEALSAGAGRGMGADQVQQLSRAALTQVAAAMGALEERDRTRADQALTAATGELRQIYDAVPARDLLRLLSQADALDNLAPILAQAHQQAIYLDPEVVRNVDRADDKVRTGDRTGAEANLAMAQRQLAADVASAPIEDAYARVVAAGAELRAGDPDRALRLLRQVPSALGRVDVSTPMVPVRFNLRAAAAAADRGKWDQARALVNSATGVLEQIATVPSASEIYKGLQPVVDRAHDLQRRFDARGKVRPQQLRDLAQRTRTTF